MGDTLLKKEDFDTFLKVLKDRAREQGLKSSLTRHQKRYIQKMKEWKKQRDIDKT